MQNFWRGFQAGGWMMYVVFALGFVALGASIRFARRGERQLLPFLRWMLVTEVVAGALGFFTGMILVFKAAARIAGGEPIVGVVSVTHVLTMGTREALSCVAASLLFALLISALIALGFRRFPQPNASSIVSE